MNTLQKFGLLIFILATLSFAPVKIKNPKVTIDELKKHVSYLASDKLKGRLTGSEGDSLSAEYIRKELKASGLVPLYSNGFQRFRVTDKIILGPANEMTVNGAKLKVEADFAPFSFSENNAFKGEVVFAGYGFSINEDSLKWNDYDGIDVKGKIVMVLRADPEVDKTMSQFIRYSRDRDKVLQAKDLGASAVLLVSGKIFDSEDKFEGLAKGEQSV
ncbi:MAG: PA domain-containing protein, partial [Mariniphaga sp.]